MQSPCPAAQGCHYEDLFYTEILITGRSHNRRCVLRAYVVGDDSDGR